MSNKNADYLDSSTSIKAQKLNWLQRLCMEICPCLARKKGHKQSQDSTKLTAAFRQSQGNQLRVIVKDFSDNIQTKRPQKTPFLSVIHSGKTQDDVRQYLDRRRTISIHTQSSPILNLKEKDNILIGQHQSLKMLAKVSSIRLNPSRQLLQKIKDTGKQNKGMFTNKKLDSFWTKRYLMFQKFDYDIRLDEGSWTHLIPQLVSEHLAARSQCDTILDAYCGIGSASIKFAKTCKRVLAADSNPLRLDYMEQNSRIYSADNIIKINKAFLDIENTRADVIFLWPDWDTQYIKDSEIDPFTYYKPDLGKIIEKALTLSQNFVLLLRQNINIHKLGQLLASILNSNRLSLSSIQLQKIYFMGKLQYVAVYYGDILNKKIKLSDQLDQIYKILNDQHDIFNHVKVVKEIRERYGMAFLLQLACESKLSLKNSTLQNFYELIRDRRLIPTTKLQSLINKQKSEPGKIITYASYGLEQQCSEHTKSYTSTNSLMDRSLQPLSLGIMRQTRLSGLYKFVDDQ